MLIGYAREGLGGDTLTLDEQKDELMGEKGVDFVFLETKDAASKSKRKQAFNMMMDYAKQQTSPVTIMVTSLDRLGTTLPQIIDRIHLIHSLSYGFRVMHNYALDTQLKSGRNVFDAIAALKDVETLLTQESNRARWSAARAGKAGRKAKTTQQIDEEAIRRVGAGERVEAVAADLGVSRSTLYARISKKLGPMIGKSGAGQT